MRLIRLAAVALLSMALPIIPSVAEAPPRPFSAVDAVFKPVPETDYSRRWLSDEEIANRGLECHLYGLCSFADIEGPACPNEMLVELDFFDKHDELIDSGVDVLPSNGRSRLLHVELGTNWLDDFATFEITNVACYTGTPTGYAIL